MNSCTSCLDEARERNREMNDLLTQAKQKSIETQKPYAICLDDATGLFIADAYTAFSQQFQVKQVVSGVQ